MAADRVRDWIDLVDERFPERDASSWDSVGLQVGDPDATVSAVLVCLDVTDATLDEAAAEGCELLLAHHPLLFRPLERLTPATAAGRLALRAARDRVAVLAAHTNLDVATPGTSDPVVDILGLEGVSPLVPQADPAAEQVKLVVFVPTDDTMRVLEALASAGAGVIGEYDQCSFRVAGTGTFRPSAAASPTLGELERLNEVGEDRLEVVLPRRLLTPVTRALVDAHPYEEVAYDVYPLVSTTPTSKGHGRVGDLPHPLPLREVADRLARLLPSPHLRVAGNLEADIRRVAACGGAGDSLIGAALAVGADCYVTGDLRHHPALDARTMGLALVDAGHFSTEAAALPAATEALRERAASAGLGARLVTSRVRTEPWVPYSPPPIEQTEGTA